MQPLHNSQYISSVPEAALAVAPRRTMLNPEAQRGPGCCTARHLHAPLRMNSFVRASVIEPIELAVLSAFDVLSWLARRACAAYIDSQRHEGWLGLDDRYDDGGYSGGTLERPALQRLIRGIEAGRVDTVVCYKIDRLSRSLTDFAKLVEVFERNRVTFVSVTQSFCTTTSMGRLTLNILLSFAQFERENWPA